jgi:hypothetical protein
VNYLLRNRVYLGEINHRSKSYPGEHEPILAPSLFDAAQAKLDENRRGLRLRHQSSKALLLGKLFDDRGNPMTLSYAIKKEVRYRYYVSCVLAQGRKEEAGSVSRVAALTLEQIVINAMGSRRPNFDDRRTCGTAAKHREDVAKDTNATAPNGDTRPDSAAATIAAEVDRITLGAQSIEIRLADSENHPPDRLTIPGRRRRFAVNAK